MHGDEGVGNLKGRRQVLGREIFRVGRRELQEEVGVKRACCEGGGRQIELGDSRNV